MSYIAIKGYYANRLFDCFIFVATASTHVPEGTSNRVFLRIILESFVLPINPLTIFDIWLYNITSSLFIHEHYERRVRGLEHLQLSHSLTNVVSSRQTHLDNNVCCFLWFFPCLCLKNINLCGAIV